MERYPLAWVIFLLNEIPKDACNEEPQLRTAPRSSNCQYSFKKKKNYLSLQYVLSVDPKVFPTPLPDPFGDVPCASHVRLKSNYLCAGLVSEMPYSF